MNALLKKLLVLLPVAVLVEGLPSEPFTASNVAGFAYLSLIGAALAYTLWFRGIAALPVGSITFLSLLSPVVAVLAGWAVLGQALSVGQLAGMGIVLGAVLAMTFRPGDAVAPVPGPEPLPESIGEHVVGKT